MSGGKIDKAFILGAGLGRRMLPVTEDIPKPMVEVAGESLVRRSIKKLAEHGVKKVVINTHHKAEKLHAHLEGWDDPQIIWSHEEQLLDTGGGIKKALAHFGGEDFFVIAGKSFWTEGSEGTALQRLEKVWDPEKMDILILLQPIDKMVLENGVGDYAFKKTGEGFGVIERSPNKSGTHMFANLRINCARIYDEAPERAFSFLDLMDRAEAQGRLYGLEHDGAWYHIPSAESLEQVNALFADHKHRALLAS